MVETTRVSTARYDALVRRAWTNESPVALRRTEAIVYSRLGLTTHSVKAAAFQRAWYDISARHLFLLRRPAPSRRAVIHELVRALVDQNYGLRRLVGLRARDHDRWLAARGIVDGTAALASGTRTPPLRGAPLDRYLQLEATVGLRSGRALAAQLRYLGGRVALASALRTFPQTTEQLLHIDKFLERERALPVRLPTRAASATLAASETFGELDVRNLLQAFGVSSPGVPAGWGGGRLAVYGSDVDAVAALVLKWDAPEDAVEWQQTVPRIVAAEFPGVSGYDCPPLDRCWSGSGEIAAGVLGSTSVLASGPHSTAVAAALLTAN